MLKRIGQRLNSKTGCICFFFLYVLCAMLFLHTTLCYAASPQQKVKIANKLYRQGKIDESLEKYNEASWRLPDSDIINFNMGAALYKKEDYQKATEAFTKVLMSEDRKTEADALYNLGNCKYKLGKLKENTDLASTISLLRESLDYYRRAVEIDQKNKDARFNHEFVEKELKVLLDKLKTQQSEKEKQQNQQEQKQEQQQDQGMSSEQKKQGEQKQQGEQVAQAQEEQQDQEKKEESVQTQQEEASREEQEQQEREVKELSKEEAGIFLERYGQEEATPDYMDKPRRGYDREVLKDW